MATRLTVRLDRAGDASRLYQLAALNDCVLAPGPFVVAELGGRIVWAQPVRGGRELVEPRTLPAPRAA